METLPLRKTSTLKTNSSVEKAHPLVSSIKNVKYNDVIFYDGRDGEKPRYGRPWQASIRIAVPIKKDNITVIDSCVIPLWIVPKYDQRKLSDEDKKRIITITDDGKGGILPEPIVAYMLGYKQNTLVDEETEEKEYGVLCCDCVISDLLSNSTFTVHPNKGEGVNVHPCEDTSLGHQECIGFSCGLCFDKFRATHPNDSWCCRIPCKYGKRFPVLDDTDSQDEAAEPHKTSVGDMEDPEPSESDGEHQSAEPRDGSTTSQQSSTSSDDDKDTSSNPPTKPTSSNNKKKQSSSKEEESDDDSSSGAESDKVEEPKPSKKKAKSKKRKAASDAEEEEEESEEEEQVKAPRSNNNRDNSRIECGRYLFLRMKDGKIRLLPSDEEKKPTVGAVTGKPITVIPKKYNDSIVTGTFCAGCGTDDSARWDRTVVEKDGKLWYITLCNLCRTRCQNADIGEVIPLLMFVDARPPEGHDPDDTPMHTELKQYFARNETKNGKPNHRLAAKHNPFISQYIERGAPYTHWDDLPVQTQEEIDRIQGLRDQLQLLGKAVKQSRPRKKPKKASEKASEQEAEEQASPIEVPDDDGEQQEEEEASKKDKKKKKQKSKKGKQPVVSKYFTKETETKKDDKKKEEKTKKSKKKQDKEPVVVSKYFTDEPDKKKNEKKTKETNKKRKKQQEEVDDPENTKKPKKTNKNKKQQQNDDILASPQRKSSSSSSEEPLDEPQKRKKKNKKQQQNDDDILASPPRKSSEEPQKKTKKKLLSTKKIDTDFFQPVEPILESSFHPPSPDRREPPSSPPRMTKATATEKPKSLVGVVNKVMVAGLQLMQEQVKTSAESPVKTPSKRENPYILMARQYEENLKARKPALAVGQNIHIEERNKYLFAGLRSEFIGRVLAVNMATDGKAVATVESWIDASNHIVVSNDSKYSVVDTKRKNEIVQAIQSLQNEDAQNKAKEQKEQEIRAQKELEERKRAVEAQKNLEIMQRESEEQYRLDKERREKEEQELRRRLDEAERKRKQEEEQERARLQKEAEEAEKRKRQEEEERAQKQKEAEEAEKKKIQEEEERAQKQKEDEERMRQLDEQRKKMEAEELQRKQQAEEILRLAAEKALQEEARAKELEEWGATPSQAQFVKDVLASDNEQENDDNHDDGSSFFTPPLPTIAEEQQPEQVQTTTTAVVEEEKEEERNELEESIQDVGSGSDGEEQEDENSHDDASSSSSSSSDSDSDEQEEEDDIPQKNNKPVLRSTQKSSSNKRDRAKLSSSKHKRRCLCDGNNCSGRNHKTASQQGQYNKTDYYYSPPKRRTRPRPKPKPSVPYSLRSQDKNKSKNVSKKIR